ncbi:hypothetical protein ABMA08_07565 [Pseudomonas yamanorum]
MQTRPCLSRYYYAYYKRTPAAVGPRLVNSIAFINFNLFSDVELFLRFHF